jgi:glycosidase
MNTASFDASQNRERLERLYGDKATDAVQAIQSTINRLSLEPVESTNTEPWSERDVVLITYGDQLGSEPKSDGQLNPLQVLRKFLKDRDLTRLINTIHILPCFPYTSDDGFSVIDYRTVDPNLGRWEDIHKIGEDCHLMLDLVLNHISQESEWFKKYLAGVSPYDRFFIEVEPGTDVSVITRPRSLPLFSEYETNLGKRLVWTTFSRDQVDLNFSEPAVLAEMLGVLLEYIGHGSRIIRLDAIAYLWKQIGTNCIHLQETHEVVKLMHDVLKQLAPQVLLLTETNVPHEENVSYFGDGDEAHMVYQFSLPPLLLDAFLNEDALPLKRWLQNLQSPQPGTTYFNFTASHDGIGVRPLEGHVDDARLNRMVEKVRSLGGAIGTRRNSDGSDTPYEMNVSYLSALKPDDGDVQAHARRFLASQAIMLALQGMPAIYFHSLVGTENDIDGMEASGIPRRINRHKFSLAELNKRLNKEGSLSNVVFAGIRHLLEVRIDQPAFHPDAQQHYYESGNNNVLCFERVNTKAGKSIFVATNFSNDAAVINLPQEYVEATDLLDPNTAAQAGQLILAPAQIVWLQAC